MTTPSVPEVEIEALWDSGLPGKDARAWSLWFAFQVPGRSLIKFRIGRPYLVFPEIQGAVGSELEKDFSLASRTSYSLYQSVGGTLVKRVGEKFTIFTSIERPDAAEAIKIFCELPASAVRAPLCAAVDEAFRGGMRFG